MKQKKLTTAQRLATLEKDSELMAKAITVIHNRQKLIVRDIQETPEEKQKRLKDKFEKVGNKTKS